MPRTTKTELREDIRQLQEWGYDIDIHWAYGQPRCTDRSGASDVSPRLPMGEMKQWLHGFLSGAIAAKGKRVAGTPLESEPCDECNGTRYPVEQHDESCSLYGA